MRKTLRIFLVVFSVLVVGLVCLSGAVNYSHLASNKNIKPNIENEIGAKLIKKLDGIWNRFAIYKENDLEFELHYDDDFGNRIKLLDGRDRKKDKINNEKFACEPSSGKIGAKSKARITCRATNAADGGGGDGVILVETSYGEGENVGMLPAVAIKVVYTGTKEKIIQTKRQEIY